MSTETTTKPKQFTTDWFSHNIQNWRLWLAVFIASKTPVVILEIGAWEGRSTCWLLDTIPMAIVLSIDTFDPESEARFDANTAEYGARSVKVKGMSLMQLSCRVVAEANSYHLIYIDGSHLAPDVLTDAVLSWPMLKSGGILIFDDYKWHRGGGPEKRPKVAIDAFLACFAGQYELLHIGHQVAIRKN